MPRERAPYSVRCGGLDPGVARFTEYAAARSYALGIANREDVQCAITDRFGNSEFVVRSGPVDPRRREYDPYRDRPFFHPNPAHPRSRKRFLRNEPQAWTPGVGPSQTQVKPQEFFGMNNTTSIIAAVAPPAMLLGLVLFLTRPRGEFEGLGRGPGGNGIGRRQRSRHDARKLYGSAVLTGQAAASMRKLALERRDRDIAQESVALQRMSQRLMDRAASADREFVAKKLSR